MAKLENTFNWKVAGSGEVTRAEFDSLKQVVENNQDEINELTAEVSNITPSNWITLKTTTSGAISVGELSMTNPNWVTNSVYEYKLTIKFANDKWAELMGQFYVNTERNWTVTAVNTYDGNIDNNVTSPVQFKIVFGTSTVTNTKFKISQSTQINTTNWALQIRKLG